MGQFAQKQTKGGYMNVTIKAVKFRTDEKLESFINEKVAKLGKLLPDCLGAEVTLKVDKPESENNKIVDMKLLKKGYDHFATKQSDTFEKGVMDCVDAIRSQIEKQKK